MIAQFSKFIEAADLRKFSTLVENNPDVVSILNDKNVYIYANPACEKVLGYKPEELVGRHNAEFIHPEDIPALKAIREKAEDISQEIHFLEFRFRHKNGSWIYLDSIGRNMLDNPDIRGRVYYSRNVTKRRALEEEYRLSTEIFKTSFNANQSLNTISDPKTGEFLDVNEAWVNILGWSKSDAIGHTANDLNIWGNPENRAIILEKLMETGSLRNFETSLYSRAGEKRDVVLSAEILEIMGRERLFFSGTDVTELKTAAEELRASETRFRRLFDNAEISIWDQDFSRIIVELDRIRRQGVTDLKKYLNDNIDEAFRLSELVIINSVNEATLDLYDVKTKEDFVDNLSGMMTEDTISVFIGALLAFWNKEEYFSTEISHKTISGKDITVILSIPIPKKREEFTHVPVSVLDITERKLFEKQARRSQKMEAVGQLTGGIAHDFNNILGIIMGNLELLESRVVGDEQALDRLDKAKKGVERGADITRKLLGFSRKNADDLSVTSLNHFIENIEELIAKSLTASITVATSLAEDLWEVTIDPGDLEDALLNLSLNARDAMPNGGNLKIETQNRTLDDEYVARNPGFEVGDYVVISVSDTGIGISEDIRENILEPFFSTKQLGKGTGLGLSMVYGFVKRSGGQLKILSETDKGTTVRLYLPRVSLQVSDRNPEKMNVTDLPKGSETILIIDDEEVLKNVAAEHLRQLDYTIVTGENATEALEILRRDRNIDLLFSDVIMPGDMDGYELAEAASAANSELKILLTSGFTKQRLEQGEVCSKYLKSVNNSLLDKPYNKSELAHAIRSAIDKIDDGQ